MNCMYLDFAAAGVEERKRFAFTAREREELCRRFLPLGGLVPVVTCGRTELYFTCPREDAERELSAFMAGRAAFAGGNAPALRVKILTARNNAPAPQGSFSALQDNIFARQGTEPAGCECRALFYCGGSDAVFRLFRLAAGLLSMLKGEDEVLGQVRDCYETARVSGCTKGMDAAFQAALACGKRVREETKISSFACSVSTLAANAVFRFQQGGNALVVGATGKMGGAVLKNILSKGGWRAVATSRSHAFGASTGEDTADYAARYEYLDGADVIVSATASPHTVFSAEKVAAALKTRKPRLFIDLSVPPDIDACVAKLPDCTLLGLDGLRAAAEENNAKKKSAVAAAEQIVRECADRFLADETARMYAVHLSVLPERERKELYVLRKNDPAAFRARITELFGKNVKN